MTLMCAYVFVSVCVGMCWMFSWEQQGRPGREGGLKVMMRLLRSERSCVCSVSGCKSNMEEIHVF